MIDYMQRLAMLPRNVGEWIGRAAGEISDARIRRLDEATECVYLEDVPLEDRPKRKWYRSLRHPNEVEAVCLHITAVRGGFGARKRDIQRHLNDGHITHDDAIVYAQADRFLATPYHAVSAKALVLNLPGEVVSWHGNGCNRYALGYAIDKAAGERMNIRREQNRFRLACERWIERFPNLAYVETHRQHSAMRGGDPGGDVCQALSPVIGELGLMWRQSKTTGTGKPMPREWLL
jgi:hypothetical protein